jgi:PAS domain S-box-containing protein
MNPNNKRLPLLFAVVLLTLVGTVLPLIFSNYPQIRDKRYLNQLATELQTAYDVTTRSHPETAGIALNTFVNQPEILGLYTRAATPTATATTRDEILEPLWLRPGSVYYRLQRRGVSQFHFHLPNGASFFRFHKSARSDDNLLNVRYSAQKANSDPTITGDYREAVITAAGAIVGIFMIGLLIYLLLMHVRQQELEREQLQANENRFRQVFETNQAIKLIINPADGTIVDANQAAVNFYGYPYTTLTGMRIAQINALPEAEIQREMERAHQEERTYFNFHHRLASGEIRDVEVYSSPFTAAGGPLLFSIIHDITERRQTEIALRESEERLALALHGAELGTWDWDIPTGHVTFDRRWAEMLGYDLAEIEPDLSSWRQLVHPDDAPAIQAILEDHLQGRTPIYQTEHRMQTKSGEWKWVLDTGKVVTRDATGAPHRAVGTLQDISALKKMTSQLVSQERLAAVGQLAAGMAHDFNNLLTGISGFTELLQLDPGTPARMRPRLQQIHHASQRAAYLVRQLQDFGQKTMRSPQAIDLPQFINDQLSFLEAVLPENTRLSLKVQPEGDYHLQADPTQLQHLLAHLVLNAGDAIPEGGQITIDLSRGEVRTGPDCAICSQPITGHWLQLTVTDTGTGIPPHLLPRIFEPFFTTKEVGKGSGLGLSQVAGIVGQQKGHIRVTSRLGQGTTLTVYLPLQPAKAIPKLPPQPESARPSNVLVIEDEPAVLEATTAMLQHLGHRVLSAPTGTEALALCDQRPTEIALVLANMSLPDMDGRQLIQRLKATTPGLPILAMSGSPPQESDQPLLDHELLGWLEKPVSLNQLCQVINSSLPRHKGRWD